MQNLKRELIAGVTTFLAMVYIAFLMPAFLEGGPLRTEEIVSNAIFGCALSTLFFCSISKKPYAFGPGIVPAGVCAAFYSNGSKWEDIFSAVLVSGLVFTILALSGCLKKIADGTPRKLKTVLNFSLGLYLMGVAIVAGNIAKPNVGFFVLELNPQSLIFCCGVATTLILEGVFRKKDIAIIAGLASAAILALVFGITKLPTQIITPPELSFIASLPIDSCITSIKFWSMVLTLSAVLIGDSVATFEIISALPDADDLRDSENRPKDFTLCLGLNGICCTMAAFLGMPSILIFFESISGVKSGGRTWVTGITVSLLFFLCLFLTPLASLIPAWISSIALFSVGYSIAKYPFFDIQLDRQTRYLMMISLISILMLGSISTTIFSLLIAYPIILWLKPDNGEAEKISLSHILIAVVAFALLLSNIRWNF